MDICWSSDSAHLISGSLDGTTILWSISNSMSKFSKIQTLEGHKRFV